MKNKTELLKAHQAGKKMKYLFFWGIARLRMEKSPALVSVSGGTLILQYFYKH